MKTTLTLLALATLFALPAAAAEELVTLPRRESVSLTIYNSVDLTLVAERRKLTFVQGSNSLAFSWANTLIDPTSVQMRAVDKPTQLEVVDTSYPPESNEMLKWTVDADAAGEYLVEISYFTSGISWSSEYHGILSTAGTSMDLTSYLTVTNNSGEDYENASVRVVLGTINLVENIADLATRGGREQAYREMRKAAEKSGARTASRKGEDAESDKAKEIIKEGLSEYYIYTVEGTETVPTGWAKRLLSFTVKDVPLEYVFTYNPAKYGASLRRVYTFKNDTQHKLGNEPLPGGTVLLYQRRDGGGLAFVARLSTEYIPKQGEVKVVGDVDPNVTLKIVRMKHERKDLEFDRRGAEPRLVGWRSVDRYSVELKNFTQLAVRVEVFISYTGTSQTITASEGTTLERHDANTSKLAMALPAGANEKRGYAIETKHGTAANR